MCFPLLQKLIYQSKQIVKTKTVNQFHRRTERTRLSFMTQSFAVAEAPEASDNIQIALQLSSETCAKKRNSKNQRLIHEDETGLVLRLRPELRWENVLLLLRWTGRGYVIVWEVKLVTDLRCFVFRDFRVSFIINRSQLWRRSIARLEQSLLVVFGWRKCLWRAEQKESKQVFFNFINSANHPRAQLL